MQVPGTTPSPRTMQNIENKEAGKGNKTLDTHVFVVYYSRHGTPQDFARCNRLL
jgi:hypothetical protein